MPIYAQRESSAAEATRLLRLALRSKDAILSDAEASSAAKTKFLANWMTERKLV